jgi:hypothetical protein
LAQLLVQRGLRYQGVDISPNMVAMAQRRLAAAGLKASFLVEDIGRISLLEPVDAIVSYMGTFFTFISNPFQLLQQIRPCIRKKIILDLNPRGNIALPKAIEMLRAAGFQNVAWRPFFVPMSLKLPGGVLTILKVCENVAVLRSLPLRWKFNVLLMGEAGFSNTRLNSSALR